MSKAKSFVSKVGLDYQMVLPREVRETLRVGPGDRVRFILGPDSVRIEKDTRPDYEPFAVFSEWSSEADEEAFGDPWSGLRPTRIDRQLVIPANAGMQGPPVPRFLLVPRVPGDDERRSDLIGNRSSARSVDL